MSSSRFVGFSLKLILIAAVMALVIGGCGNGAKDVEVTRVGPRALDQTVMVAGSVSASEPAQVIPQVYGSVAAVFVQEGQQVAAGQPLLQLDTSDLEQSLLSARASLESSQALSSMFNSLSASAASMGRVFQNALSSIDSGVTSLYELEKTLVPMLPEEFRLEALQAIEFAYQQYQEAVSGRPGVSFSAGGVSTGAQQAAANKAIENAQKNLEAATITAPVAGTVVSASQGGLSIDSMMGTFMSSFSSLIPSGLDISALTGLTSGMSGLGMPSGGPLVPGSYVMPGSPIYTIVDLSQMTMTAKVDESDIAKMAEGQTATVMLEAYPDKEFSGVINRVADTATTNEAGATAFDVMIQLDPADFDLKIGMTGTADVVVASKKDALAVPIEALVDKDGKKYVFKVVDGKAELTEVELGIVTEDRAEITGGVSAGDNVVTKGVEKLKDGQSVSI